jgi:hypothetical protein
MDTCVVDKMPEQRTPPSREAIDQARERQLTALREVRRLLKQAHTIAARPRAIAG